MAQGPPRLAGDFRVHRPRLAAGLPRRCPCDPDADLSPRGVAGLIADFLDALDLERVTLVANDTGGAIASCWSPSAPQRVARLVLTPCDAYENFLPPAFRPMQYVARVPGLLNC